MKKHLRRRLKACFHQMLAAEQVMAIHEPALGTLLSALTLGEELDRPAIAAALNMASSDPPTTQMVGNVAVLPIFGIISQKSNWLTRALGWTALETLERDLVEALANSQVKSIVLFVDSPGGTAIGNEEVSRKIFQGREKKPIYAFVRGICASAAYYNASAAKQVFASPSSTVGSIGAVSTHIEWSKAFSEMGAGITVVRSAPNKQLQNPYEKLSPEGKAELQRWVGAYGDQFEKAVARYRGVSQANVKAKFGQGDYYLAAEATQRGLIDGVATWEQVLAKIAGKASSGPPATGDDDGSGEAVTRSQTTVPKSTALVSQSILLAEASARDIPPAFLKALNPGFASTADGSLVSGWSASLQAAFDAAASGNAAAASAASVSNQGQKTDGEPSPPPLAFLQALERFQ